MPQPLTQNSKSFGKEEKLKLRKDIETLFRIGKAFSVLPIRVIYTIKDVNSPTPLPIQIGISVPKKRFKHAVDRNRIKRLIREAWRHQKHLFLPYLSNSQQVQLFFVYQNNKMPSYDQIYALMQDICRKLEGLMPTKND